MLVRVVAILVIFLSFCFALTPLYEARHYKVFSLENEQTRLTTIEEEKEVQLGSKGDFRTIIERPTNTSSPPDDGSALFGDIWFTTTRKDGELLIRDTIVNQITDQNVYIYYNRSLPGYYVEDMRVFNVGRQRGYVYRAYIAHNVGYVETQLTIAANNTVRIFVEIYIRVED